MKKQMSKHKNHDGSRKGFGKNLFLLIFFVLICFAVIAASGIFPFSGSSKTNASTQKPAPPMTVEDDGKISPQALLQIEALQQEKESRTPAQKKIDSRLLYKIRMERGEAIASGVQTLDTDLKVDEQGFIDIDLTANISDRLMSRLKNMNAVVIASFPQYRSVTARIPIAEIESLAELGEIIFVQPKLEGMPNKIERSPELNLFETPNYSSPFVIKTKIAPDFATRAENVRNYLSSVLSNNLIPETGSVNAQGDTTHRANIARQLTGATGAGLKIGVLSDGVNSLAASQASGDLPATVNVLPGQAGVGDEGTAMLQIVYDTAPGATLYYATANTSLVTFAQNIKDLRTAGCDIIIDDFTYFVESPFQNGQAASVVAPTNGGLLIQSVNEVTVGSQAGALYFSSAANSGNKNDNTAGVWEGDFVDGGDTTTPLPTGTGSKVHSFGASTFNTLTVAGRVLLKWSDPLGASSNDYDLFALDSTGTTVAASSTNIQSGTQDPSEDIGNRTAGQRIVIVKKAAAAARFLHLNTNRGVLTTSTTGVIYGHNGGLNTISVAATPAGPAFSSLLAIGPFPNAHSTANVVEIFSSDGPRRIFYHADSTAITPGNVSSTGGQVLQKPDLTAADGVSTTAPGFLTFFGTSAAAPQAGAIAAILKTASPTSTNTQIYNALISSALDIEAPGVDRDSGAGIIMPIPAMAALGVTGNAYIENGTVSAVETVGNGNGKIEAGETANVTVQLKNIGFVAATAVSATLTTSTPGVTITQGTQAYSNLAALNGSATNAVPYKFTLANNFLCGAPVNFTLTVSYTGGGSPQIVNFSVNTGTNSTVTSTLDTTPPANGAGYTAATGIQTNRLNRNGLTSTCGMTKATPALQEAAPGTSKRFDSYTYTASASGCVTVSIVPSNSTALFSAAYGNGGYNPSAIQSNYLADYGVTTPGTISYGFNVTAGQQYTIVIHEVNTNGGIGVNYTMTVAGPANGVCLSPPSVKSRADFDGDGKTDLSVFRPSEGNWYLNRSTAGFTVANWGLGTDIPTPGDFDGDGKTDVAIFRPSTGQWFILRSSDGGYSAPAFGTSGDIPVQGDFDGDNKADLAVFRPSNNVWYILNSGGGTTITAFGAAGDVPVRADYNGDGKTDIAIFRPSTGQWWIAMSGGGITVVNLGLGTDKPVPADYDGDNKDDVAVYRPSTGYWYFYRSSDGNLAFLGWGGNAADIPVPGDYDGDGLDDLAVYRNGTWYVYTSQGGSVTPFGLSSDTAIPTRYIP